MTHAILLAACLAPSAPPAEEQQPAPATFFIVRHAERPGRADALSEAGKKRAVALRDFMVKQRVKAVYSTQTKRTMGTAEPTAKAIGVKVQAYKPLPTPPKEWFAAMAKKHAGQSVLIVGHSNTVVPFTNGFGANMKYKFTEDEYHLLFIVSAQNGSAQAVRINYGDVPTTKAKKIDADMKMAPQAPSKKKPVGAKQSAARGRQTKVNS